MHPTLLFVTLSLLATGRMLKLMALVVAVDTSAATGRGGQGGKLPVGLLGGLFAGVITAIALVVLAVLLYRRRR